MRDPIEAAERVIRMLKEKKVRAIDGNDVAVTVETICVHGDNPEAVEFVQKLRERLTREEVMIAAPVRKCERPQTSKRTRVSFKVCGLLDATMIVVGSMIGSGIFIVSAESSRLIGAPGFLLLTWIIAGVLTITGALCCAELAAMMPRAGGPYVFLREAYGPSTGFLYGWAVFVVIQTGTIAAVAVAFAKFLGVLVPAIATENYLIAPIRVGSGYAISLSTEQLVAIGLIFLLTWTNTRGLELGKLVQNIFTLAKTAALIALIVIGLSLGWKSGCAALSADGGIHRQMAGVRKSRSLV